ncbi:hypothetical protein GO755_11805 [Spirosoma sp. HMF4905]|uniref:Peptidase M56 domain-containing protein n=1 Tax=Spirosoma arboris TaxID=2682092 RepID=A0A7K1SAM8_9BACT|nr:M56 family metallopeptidase [Spirosoma arboris]MVM30718.1 hypothetical protein [Spirosoma arboris]
METLRYVVLANALLAVVSIAYYALLRRETFFGANRLALWVGLAGALLLPLLELPDWRPERVRTVMYQTAQVIVPKVLPNLTPSQPEVTITFPNQKTYRLFRHPSPKFVWSWPVGLLLLYISGVFFLFIRFGIQLFSLRRLIRQSVHEPYDDFTLVRNEATTSPFSFFDWVVLNPRHHAPDELDQILRHERVHVRERHSYDMLGAELVCIIFWFNPAAYLFRQLLHQTLEFSADRAVLAEGVDAKAYQYNLVKVSMSYGQSAITNHFSKSQLKTRISMLNKPESSAVTWLKYPVLFIAALTVASAFAPPQPSKALSNYIPKPGTEPISAIVEVAAKPDQSSKTLTKQVIGNESIVSKSDDGSMSKFRSTSVGSQIDSVNNLSVVDSVRISPSRAADDETIVSQSIDDKKMEYLILEGERKYGHLGIGFRKFDKEEVQKQSSSNSSLSVKPDGSLSVDNAANMVKVFINNEPSTPEAIRMLKIDQLYTVAVILGYNQAAQKRSDTVYLLFYVNEDN